MQKKSLSLSTYIVFTMCCILTLGLFVLPKPFKSHSQNEYKQVALPLKDSRGSMLLITECRSGALWSIFVDSDGDECYEAEVGIARCAAAIDAKIDTDQDFFYDVVIRYTDDGELVNTPLPEPRPRAFRSNGSIDASLLDECVLFTSEKESVFRLDDESIASAKCCVDLRCEMIVSIIWRIRDGVVKDVLELQVSQKDNEWYFRPKRPRK